jgi:hypothetical protein
LIVDLDHDDSLDPDRVGAKSASLARAKRAGLPVLPGLVVESLASRGHMALGAATLPTRGSGGARLAITSRPIGFADELVTAACSISDSLVARSSTLLESSGEWSGAFTSYVDVAPDQLPKAVVGCWASAFTVAALQRQEAAGTTPGSLDMAVLVQPFLDATVGGTAELAANGSTVVRAVKGSPAPLLQGWVKGVEGRADPDGSWYGQDLIDLVGISALNRVRDSLSRAYAIMGSNHCEWAIDEEPWILQLDVLRRPDPAPPLPNIEIPADLMPTIRALVSAPGRLGEELVLPWALGGIPQHDASPDLIPQVDVRATKKLAQTLTSQVWGMDHARASMQARRLLDRLKGSEPHKSVDRIRSLNRPNPELSRDLLARIAALQTRMVESGAAPDTQAAWHLSLSDIVEVLNGHARRAPNRVGRQPWEPLIASAVLEHGTRHHGSPAASGIGAGIRMRADNPGKAMLTHRGVISASQPLASLAQLLWDAAGLVTRGGSPAAHLFESARSLGIPAVCGVDLGGDQDQIVAVDGYSGVVATLPLRHAV